MRTYTIYHQANSPADILKSADGAIFVKDGFSKAGLFGQLFWLLAHRLWIAAAIYSAILVLVVIFGSLLAGQAGGAIFLAAIIIGFAIEANDIRTFFLSIRGYKLVGVIEGASLGACEQQFFRNLEKSLQSPSIPAHQRLQKPPILPSPSLVKEEETAIGLFPKPGV